VPPVLVDRGAEGRRHAGGVWRSSRPESTRLGGSPFLPCIRRRTGDIQGTRFDLLGRDTRSPIYNLG
jgi:hypothetical protein